jgi:hypothetical protein
VCRQEKEGAAVDSEEYEARGKILVKRPSGLVMISLRHTVRVARLNTPATAVGVAAPKT